MNLYNTLKEETEKRQEEKTRREKEERRRKQMKKDYSEAKNEFISAENKVHALQAYKFFIENIYERFIINMIDTGGERILDDTAIKGVISFGFIQDFDSPSRVMEIEGSLAYVLDESYLTLCTKEEVLDEFSDLLLDFSDRYSLDFNGYGSKVSFNIPMKNIVDSYYSELQAIPYVDEQIHQIAEDYNVELGEYTLRKIM